MNRRGFIGASVAAGALAAPALATGRAELTMVTSWGRGLAGVFDSAQFCADAINQMSDGAIKVEVKAAGELVGAFDVFDAVSEGRAAMYHAADYYFIEKHPGYAFYTTVPFGMTAIELGDWYYHGGGGELHDELGKRFNLKSFLAGNTGAQGGGWFRREITAPTDFDGLRFRMPGLGGEVLRSLGAEVVNLPGSEVYQRLATGDLDGTEWIGPWADEKAGFQEITKIFYAAGFHEPGTGLSLGANRDVFEDLRPAQKRVIELAAAAAHQWTHHLFNSKNGAALKRLQADGVKVATFPDDVWDAFGASTKGVLDRYREDALFARIYESYYANMRASSGWASLSSRAYVRQRDRILGAF